MVKFMYSKSVPSYVISDIRRFGYKFDVCEKDLHDALGTDNLIAYDHDLETIIDNVQKINHTTVVIIIDHHFLCHERMQKLDELSKGKSIWFLGTQYLKNLYQNINCMNYASSELWCYHDFIHFMISHWRETRSQTHDKPYLFLKAAKAMPERSQFIAGITKICKNDLVSLDKSNEVIQFQNTIYDNKDEFTNWMKETFNNEYLLGGFGTGTPRFDLYDKVFCEIVIETIYNTPTIHVTEKTWRPIACGVPTLLLLNRQNLDYIEDLGYRLGPKDFYDNLKTCHTVDQVLGVFEKYNSKVKNDESFRQQLKDNADYNFEHFWKIKSNWDVGIKAFSKIFGHNPFDVLFEKLKHL